jgi:hypothetical protein
MSHSCDPHANPLLWLGPLEAQNMVRPPEGKLSWHFARFLGGFTMHDTAVSGQCMVDSKSNALDP